MPIRIGLPQGLLHYYYGQIWEKFFYQLGAEVLVSGKTTKAMLDFGGKLDEVCLPVKAYLGHVYQIYQEVDCLFVPRIVSIARGQFTCPKLIGLPDLIKSNIERLPPVISSEVDLWRSPFTPYRRVIDVGHMVKAGALESLHAWYRACQNGQNVQTAIQTEDCRLTGPKIALIGHPYIIYDRQIGMDIINKLEKMNINVITPQMVEPKQVKTALALLNKRPYWSYCGRFTGAALALMQSQTVDGMIFITSFSCGPDSLMADMVKQQAEQRNLPFMLLTVDEHTAEEGFITRLEAFSDMLARRNVP